MVYVKRLLLYVLLHTEHSGKNTNFTLTNIVHQLIIAFKPNDALYGPNFSHLLRKKEVLQYTAVNLKSNYIESTTVAGHGGRYSTL